MGSARVNASHIPYLRSACVVVPDEFRSIELNLPVSRLTF